MGTGEFNAGGNPATNWHPIQGGVEIFLIASCHGNRDKLRPDEPLGSYADFTFTRAQLNNNSRQNGARRLGSRSARSYGREAIFYIQCSFFKL